MQADSMELVAWMEGSLARVMSDFDRARALAKSAISSLFQSFTELSAHLAEERAHYEVAVQAINGAGGDAGLVGVLREVLGQFLTDIANVGQCSVRILLEVDTLRGHADQVAKRGLRLEQVAQTTRMISLNARIEANRVASAGAVFGVVADEIKALAKESGELSKAIRDAIALQAASLHTTWVAASNLSSIELDHALESNRRLEETVAQLSRVSAASTRALDRIQTDVSAAIQALQFEDMLDQLLRSIHGKLDTLRRACASAREGSLHLETLREADATVNRDVVRQQDITVGEVELF